ncbi:hypothetical protein A4X06_0g5561 [Tilletia controversa]|uniref:Uncharacterized protein n=1 Tax=Tilletia controversa TaxID=13291 RepID=A0A8X7MR59_9BASI|nr:hypothetical protein A4X06_0g5561 [Tilletia controversa]
MKTLAVSVGLRKKAIAELVRFGLLFQALGIYQIAASVFVSADVQTYSEEGDLPRVVSIFLERNPELISPAFAERYKTAEVHFLALISSHIKKKCNNLRSHTRDKVPITKERILRLAYLRKFAAKTNPREVDGDPVDGWWEQVDQSVMKLLSTTRRDAEKGRRILNATYEVDKANFGDFARQEKWISKAGSNDAEISSAFSEAANQNEAAV